MESILALAACLPVAAYGDAGSLSGLVEGKQIDCPLKHTQVLAKISGPLATVTVRQDFVNESPQTIEAIYTFPLPDKAAVYGYSMLVGERKIRGKIATREDALKAYQEASRQGRAAGLLDQERPNVFRQAVANIPAGAKVSVEIHYVELVPYENQTYEFVFPMVVGPRYFPQQTGGAERVNPPVAAKGTRAGHDIAITVELDMPQALAELKSLSHAIQVEANRKVTLARAKEIPNQDFILSYRLAAKDIAPSILTHAREGQGYFSLVLDPPAVRSLETNITPKELVFVLDTSGSMHGFPLEKAKESMLLAIDGLNPRDTFNLITFAGDTHVLWTKPQPATPENVNTAKRFIASRQGSGGTEMLKAIRAAFAGMDSQEHLRIVCFMTDGYIGNEREIIDEIRRHPQARVFSFGIGSSVNRYLLNQMAQAGRGEVEYVTLNSDGSAAARRFHERVRNPLLTDIRIEFIGLDVREVTPVETRDLFSAKPVIVSGRYTRGGSGVVRICGQRAGRPWERDIPFTLPAQHAGHESVPLVWARQRIEELSANPQANKEAITQLGLAYGLMTEYTSYVAIGDPVTEAGATPLPVPVLVDMPGGLTYEGVFGNRMYAAMPTALFNRVREEPAAKVNIKLLLKRNDAEVLAKLASLGFQMDEGQPAGALFLSGTVDRAKLAELRKLPFVSRVELEP
jgi:Ca-activated chloride channel family protein